MCPLISAIENIQSPVMYSCQKRNWNLISPLDLINSLQEYRRQGNMLKDATRISKFYVEFLQHKWPELFHKRRKREIPKSEIQISLTPSQNGSSLLSEIYSITHAYNYNAPDLYSCWKQRKQNESILLVGSNTTTRASVYECEFVFFFIQTINNKKQIAYQPC